MEFYQRFCEETYDEAGRLTGFSLRYPENYNFGYDGLDGVAADHPNGRALVWRNPEGEARDFTFDEIRRLSNRAANVFRAGGIQKGDKVMVILKRHWEYWVVAVALHKLGAVLAPVTHMLTAKDMAYRIDLADIRAAVCTSLGQVGEQLLEAQKLCPQLTRLWMVQGAREGFLDFNAQMEEASEELERIPTLATDPMVMYFTSGTTGYPKAVIHDHTYSLSHIITAKHWQQVERDGLHFTVSETGWAKASWGKLYGQWLCECGVMVYDFDNFDPKQLMEVINECGVTSFCAPPTVYRYFVKKGVIPMPTLKHASTAGEALSPEVFRLFEEKTGLPLMEGYGQTESTLIIGNLKGGTAQPGSLGRPTPLYHVELVDEEGNIVPDGEVGELVIVPPEKGVQHGIFQTYWENPSLYRHVWRGGVYHTGDTAWKDENGDYWYNGRIDDVIKTGGFRVGPYEIEDVLIEHPAVLECSAVGVPDELRGQAIQVYVTLNSGYSPSPALKRELREFCNSRLAQYKWVRHVELVDELPKTISGKVRKVELRERG